jgi:hypothetical protein
MDDAISAPPNARTVLLQVCSAADVRPSVCSVGVPSLPGLHGDVIRGWLQDVSDIVMERPKARAAPPQRVLALLTQHDWCS